MDALRASTMLLLVPVHAAALLAQNGHRGGWATAVYWLVHVFRLPLFFTMSGFFLAFMLGRKGLRQTARNRTLRIVVPLLLGLLTVVPLTVFAAERSGIVLSAGRGVPTGSPFTFEPGFLWFLWYLLIVDCAAVALFLTAPGAVSAVASAIRQLIRRPAVGIAMFSLPTAAALWPEQNWVAAPAVDTFVPALPVLLYYSLFFALGATLCVHRDLVSAARAHAWRWTACAVCATVPAALLFSLHNAPAYGSRPEVHAAALLIYATATWTTLIALVGLADRYARRPRPVVRYMADASYWIYLSHMPSVVLLVAAVGATALGTASQFALVTLGSLAVSLLTYPLLVRYTLVGRLLNGRRARRRRFPAPRLALTRPAA
jgi:fucose 4-O-acetylase-like acetyltransferase